MAESRIRGKSLRLGGVGQWGIVLHHPTVAGVRYVKIARPIYRDSTWKAQIVLDLLREGAKEIACTRCEAPFTCGAVGHWLPKD